MTTKEDMREIVYELYDYYKVKSEAFGQGFVQKAFDMARICIEMDLVE